MTQASYAVATLIVSALTFPFVACGKPNQTGVLIPTTQIGLPTSEEIAIRIEPTEISFTHTVGRDPCPQLVGRVTIRNVGSAPFRTDLRSTLPAPLSFGPDQTVPPGGSVTIDVFFTCDSQTSFTVLVDTLSPQAGRIINTSSSQFTVKGTIVR